MSLIEQPFLSKITTDYLWNFSFFEVSMHLISNFTCKDTTFKRISSSCYGIFFNWTKKPLYTSVLKKGVFEIMEELMLYFMSVRAWVDNLHIKNRIKNLMVIMPSYFYKDIEDKTWKYSVRKAILVTSQTCKLHSTLYWCFHWLKDIHREKAQSNKTPAHTKSTNITIWAVGTSNQLFIEGS